MERLISSAELKIHCIHIMSQIQTNLNISAKGAGVDVSQDIKSNQIFSKDSEVHCCQFMSDTQVHILHSEHNARQSTVSVSVTAKNSKLFLQQQTSCNVISLNNSRSCQTQTIEAGNIRVIDSMMRAEQKKTCTSLHGINATAVADQIRNMMEVDLEDSTLCATQSIMDRMIETETNI